MPNLSTKRRGFSLIELLVVGGIVAVLAALAPSAIQQAREAARKSTCRNNLKQIGLALHNYHDTFATFPPAWIAKTPAPTEKVGFGWQTFILPQIDQAPLYDRIDFDNPLPDAETVDSTGRKMFQLHLAVYRCPSDPTSIINSMRGNYGTSNYSANYGDNSVPRWTTGRRTVNWPGQIDTPRKTNGIMYWNSKVRLRDMTDGPSNTFLAGERSVSSGSGIWPGVGANIFENDVATDCSHASRLNGGPTSFSSAHADGANFLFGDGSVQFIDDGIDSQPNTMGEMGAYQRLSNRRDGNPLGEF